MQKQNSLSFEEMQPCLHKMNKILDQYFDYVSDEPSEVIDNFLWLGDFEDSKNFALLEKKGIKYILNCAGYEISNVYPTKNGIEKVFKIYANDRSRYNIVESNLSDCINFIDECKKNNGKILVHCVAGMNRSATMVVGYIVTKYKNVDLLSAVEMVAKKRPWILTNEGFKRQLIQYAHSIGKLSLNTQIKLQSKL